MSDIVIFGAGGTATLAAFYFEHDSPHRVVAFTVDGAFLREPTHEGRPVVAFEELAAAFPPSVVAMFVAVGPARVNSLRAEKCQAARAAGYRLVSYVSSRASVWPGFEHGENAFILENTTLQPFCRLGDNVVVRTGANIGHDVVLGDNVFVGPQAVIAGHARVGAASFIGANSTIRDHVKVGKRCVVGAGSLIGSDTDDESVYTPAPARRRSAPSGRLRRL